MTLKKLSLVALGVIMTIPSLFAQSELKVMFSQLAGMAPTVNASDPSIPLSSVAGVYEGIISMPKSKSFAFYAGTQGSDDFVRYSATYNTSISFTDDNLVWPQSGNEEEAENAMMVKNSTNLMVNWYITNFSEFSESTAQVKVTVNLNNLTLKLEQQPYTSIPEAMYLWGSVNGGGKYNMLATLAADPTNPNLFKAVYDVPEVPQFDNTDSEFGPSDGDPDYGFMFYLSTDGESVSAGQIYNAPLENKIIEFAGDVDSFSVNLLKGTGAVMFDLSPGMTTFTFDYESKLLTVAPVSVSDIPDSQKLFVMTATNYYAGPWNPSDDDPALVYNASTGLYEGVTLEVKKGNAFKLYQKNDDGSVTIIGGETVMAIDFTLGNPYSKEFGDGSSAFYISKFYVPTDTEGVISIAVDLENHSIIVKQIDATEIIPEALYIWGSEDGAPNGKFTKMGEMTPSEDNPLLFTVTFDVPECPGPFVYDDPEFAPSEEDAPTHGFMFLLSPESENINKSNILRIGGIVNSRTINMAKDEKTAVLQLVRNTGGAIIDQTPGVTVFTLDFTTLEFTATRSGNSAVESLEPSADSSVKVFNLQGVKVYEGNGDSMPKLPAGIYIVNGKKVVK